MAHEDLDDVKYEKMLCVRGYQMLVLNAGTFKVPLLKCKHLDNVITCGYFFGSTNFRGFKLNTLKLNFNLNTNFRV